MKAYHFDPEQARDALVEALKNLAREQGFDKVALGVSGGKDSTVTAALCARALGKENVYGVMMPDGTQADIADSIRVCECLGIQKRTVNIGKMHEALRAVTDQIAPTAPDGEFSVPYSRESDINVGPRLRMKAWISAYLRPSFSSSLTPDRPSVGVFTTRSRGSSGSVNPICTTSMLVTAPSMEKSQEVSPSLVQ